MRLSPPQRRLVIIGVALLVGYGVLLVRQTAAEVPKRPSTSLASASARPVVKDVDDDRRLSSKPDPLATLRRAWSEPRVANTPHTQPVHLDLRLPDRFMKRPEFSSRELTFRRFGFDLEQANALPLDRLLPDYRSDACLAKAETLPRPEDMPTVSVIVIYYNEPVATLMRNVVSVLNRSPPALLGEIILVDDKSLMDEHEFLEEHVARLQAQLPPGKLRHVHRTVHNGIVGARVRGAEEAIHDIVLFLDSHAEVADGWLEPLIARIHEDRTRVVVPNIRGFNLDTLALTSNPPWPPYRGSFNWRLSFTIITADLEHDMLESGDKTASAVKSPVMPGGLFAMDRRLFFELGAYDPEIFYYGAEHVELSFRVWMCGGSMESVPCSNVGHIYREFNRFGQDPQLENVNIGRVLDRNDHRVAEVWMDDHKRLFQDFRHLRHGDVGNVSARRALRDRLQCKSFQWFLDEVCRDMYVPPFSATPGRLSSPDGALCLTNADNVDAPPALQPCRGVPGQQWVFANGYIQRATYVGSDLPCLRVNRIAQVDCASAVKWKFAADSTIRPEMDPSQCLARGVQGGDSLKLRPCSGGATQLWTHAERRTLSGPFRDQCIDNMSRKRGPVGMYPCHGGGTQQWTWASSALGGADGAPFALIKSGAHSSTCLGFDFTAAQFHCLGKDADYEWRWVGQTIRPLLLPEQCLTRLVAANAVAISACHEPADDAQIWLLH